MPAATDILNRLKQRFQSLPSHVRMGTIGLSVIVCLILGFTFSRQQLVVKQELLFGGRMFSPSELALMEASFAKANLNDYNVQTGRMSIPHGQKALYVGALVDGDALPANFDSFPDEALRGSSPWESQKQREQRVAHARQKQLALVIRAMDGVEDATVQFDETSSGGFPRVSEVTALVGVLCSEQHRLDIQRVRSIRQLVSAAKAGLKPEQVTVSDLRSGQAYSGPLSAPVAPTDGNAYLALKNALEREWAEKTRLVLRFVPGAEVAVNVELASDQSSGRLPPAPTPNRLDSGSPRLVPVRVTASISVPRSYFARFRPSADRADLARREEATRHKIESAVAALLPTPAPGDEPARQVMVTIFDDVSTSPATPPATADRFVAFMKRRFNVLGVLLMTLVCLILIYHALRSSQSRAAAAARQSHKLRLVQDESNRDRQTETPAPAGSVASPQPASLREELARIVSEDPHSAAGVVQNWIGRAS